jgi:hypothetical protein
MSLGSVAWHDGKGSSGLEPSKASTDAGVLWKGRVGPGEVEEEVVACVPEANMEY